MKIATQRAGQAGAPSPDAEYGAMRTFDFTLIVAGSGPRAPDFADRFYEAGCDDALLGVVDGVVQLHFVREAATLEEAIASATRDVEAAEASVLEVTTESPAAAW